LLRLKSFAPSEKARRTLARGIGNHEYAGVRVAHDPAAGGFDYRRWSPGKSKVTEVKSQYPPLSANSKMPAKN